MKNKKLFFKAINTLLFSWGGDTPPDAIWAANELLDFYEKETDIVIEFRLSEDSSDVSWKLFEQLSKDQINEI